MRQIEGISEYCLDNGLKVLLFPDESQSTVTVNITYLVGSRHEGRGEAGMAHLLEHMLFKGTPKYPDSKGVLQDKGAFFNATTWFDRTNYYETLPASEENLCFALEFEADRMINSWIRQADLDAEMTVVRNEFEMGENDPIGVLHDQIMSAAYRWHNYGKTTIGNRSDIERVPVDNLRAFYQKYYQPDNAVLIVAGQFQDAVKLIEKYFAPIMRPTRVLEATYTEEPAQDGARQVRLMRVGEVACTGAAYHIPAGSHPDYAAIRILSDVLTNEPGGYLYKTLVETGEASDVFGMAYSLAEPGLMMLFARPTVATDVMSVHDKLIHKIESDREGAISSEAVERARSRLLKGFKLSLSNSKELALKLSEFIAQGGFELYFWYRDQIKKVTVADVERVAQNYLIESNRTAGVFIPTKDPVRAQIPATPNVAEMLKGYEGSETLVQGEEFEATVENIEKSTHRVILQGHIRAAFLPKQTRGDMVRASMIFRYGTEHSLAGHLEALSVLPSLMMRGTEKRDHQQLQDRLDELQSTVNVYAGSGATGVDITSDRAHLLDTIALVAEIMKAPRFSEAEWEIVKKKELAELEEAAVDPQQLGFNELSRRKNPWPKGSVHYVPTLVEKAQTIQSMSRDDLKKLYTEFYGANHLELSVIGSFDEKQVSEAIGEHFGTWKSKQPFERIKKTYKPVKTGLEVVSTPDKQMAIVAMAVNLPLIDTSPDYPAVRFANYIFGESMKSRLLHCLREKEGLSYGAGSWLETSKHEEVASLSMYAMAATDNADKALELMRSEYRRWIDHGITDDELAEGKASFKSTVDNMLASDSYVVHTLSADLEIGRTFAHQQKVLDAILSLSINDVKKVLTQYFDTELTTEVKSGALSKAAHGSIRAEIL